MGRRVRFGLLLAAGALVAAAAYAGYRARTATEVLTARLLFGPSELPMLVGVRGNEFLLDRDGDGRFARDETFALGAGADTSTGVEVADPDGKTRYAVLRASTYDDPTTSIKSLMVRVDVRGPVAYEQYCDVQVSPGGAAVAHFHGPLTIGPSTINWEVPASLKLVAGDKPTDLRAVVGTFDKARRCWTVVVSDKVTIQGDQPVFGSAFPDGVRPVVDIEFPGKDGGPPVKRRYSLDKVC